MMFKEIASKLEEGHNKYFKTLGSYWFILQLHQKFCSNNVLGLFLT